MSKRFPKPEITLDRIYSKFADERYCKDFLLDIRFEKGFACPFCGGSEFRKISTRHLLRCKSCNLPRKRKDPHSVVFCGILLQIQPPPAWEQCLFKAFGGACAVILSVVCKGDNHKKMDPSRIFGADFLL